MGERHTLKLTGANRARAYKGVEAAIAKAKAGGEPWTLELRQRTRTDEQNDALHGLVDQILKQRPVHRGVRMDKARYKAVFMQALGHEMTMLPTLEGDGFFPMGLHTSRLTVAEFADLLELMLAWCAREGLTIKHFDESTESSQGAGGGQNLSGGAVP